MGVVLNVLDGVSLAERNPRFLKARRDFGVIMAPEPLGERLIQLHQVLYTRWIRVEAHIFRQLWLLDHRAHAREDRIG